MKNKKYYVGLDIGTDSVGYAVTDESYNLCKYKGKPMWGVTLFDEASLADKRRAARSARRRLDRRQQRVNLLMELFAREISKVDADFYRRIKASYLYPEKEEDKVRIFDSYDEQKKYMNSYPTIHHLICELMNSKDAHDVRLVYLACAWLVAHRGHFLNEVDKDRVDEVTDFNTVYRKLADYIAHDGFVLPWDDGVDLDALSYALKSRLGLKRKSIKVAEVLFGGKAPKVINEQYEYNYELVIKLLCGGEVSLSALFGKDEYDDLECKKVSLDSDDNVLAALIQSLGDDGEFISVLKGLYDWSVLADVLGGKTSISSAKVAIYDRHAADLRLLKSFIRKYAPDKYSATFRSEKIQNNYVSYIGKSKTANEKVKSNSCGKADFCKYILAILKGVMPDETDKSDFDNMISRLESNDFMPKQVDGDNRVIPYQLYWYELNRILDNAKEYIPFLGEVDADGISGKDKVLSVFEFRVPYYVGPLCKNPSNKNSSFWMVRRTEGRIYPWNFEQKVDLDKSEDEFIKRMTNSCTYLPGEDVLPKNSLVYCAFEVLNEINNIKIDGNTLPVEVKQGIFSDVFMAHDKVTVSRIKKYLESRGYVKEGEYLMTGLDVTVKSSLKPFRAFKKIVECGLLSYPDIERIINRATYSEDNRRFEKWLSDEYPKLSSDDVKYIAGMKFKGFGRLSRKLLCGIEGAINESTGEYMSVIRTMWETNNTLMQLLTDRFDFASAIQEHVTEYYAANPKTVAKRLEDMCISNSVKRPIIRTLDILKDVTRIQGCAPEMIFVEMARGTNEDLKGKRTRSRLSQIAELYEKVSGEEVRVLQAVLDEWGDSAHVKLQSDKLFLYFIQLGRCLYTGEAIDINSIISGDGKYNIEHIYPRSFVKDDSVINNKILVNSKANGDKSDIYPISSDIRSRMHSYWTHLNAVGLISDEKYKRLTRQTPFTDEEKFEFINRQLVETRQSTKAVATLLKEMYPNTEIVYVKAGLVSDFRHEFGLLKSRAVNDLHHAKDAYLNIVVGNVWHHKFSRRFWCAQNDNNAKPEIVFTHSLKVGGRVIWNGAEDKCRVIEIARKNTASTTVYSYYKHSGQNGGLFDQNPLRAKAGLIPLKKGMPTEIYGGYNSATVSGFVLARYKIGKKLNVSFVPIKLMYMREFQRNADFANNYVLGELGEKATDIEILLDGRILKIYTVLSLDGARFSIRGKSGSSDIGLMNIMPYKTSSDYELYIKKLEVLLEKVKKNPSYIWDERYDVVSKERNALLYRHYIEKLSKWPYNKRPGITTLVEKIKKRESDFNLLDIFKQTAVLLQIQGMLGRVKEADLSHLNESSSSGIAKISLNLSSFKKNYTDVRIVDTSASGLFEKLSDNLLDLL